MAKTINTTDSSAEDTAQVEEIVVAEIAEQTEEPVSIPTISEDAQQPPAPEQETPRIQSVVTAQKYSFYDLDGSYKSWEAGQTVTDPTEIYLLIGRKAPLVGI